MKRVILILFVLSMSLAFACVHPRRHEGSKETYHIEAKPELLYAKTIGIFSDDINTTQSNLLKIKVINEASMGMKLIYIEVRDSNKHTLCFNLDGSVVSFLDGNIFQIRQQCEDRKRKDLLRYDKNFMLKKGEKILKGLRIEGEYKILSSGIDMVGWGIPEGFLMYEIKNKNTDSVKIKWVTLEFDLINGKLIHYSNVDMN